MATFADKSILNNITLTYFGLTGRGESIRLALAINGDKWTDKRITFPEWGAIKPTTPWGRTYFTIHYMLYLIIKFV